jgi:hypothetical protein
MAITRKGEDVTAYEITVLKREIAYLESVLTRRSNA